MNTGVKLSCEGVRALARAGIVSSDLVLAPKSPDVLRVNPDVHKQRRFHASRSDDSYAWRRRCAWRLGAIFDIPFRRDAQRSDDSLTFGEPIRPKTATVSVASLDD